MALEAVVVPFQVAASTGSGTLDITSSGFGTPTGAYIVLGGSPNDSSTEVSDQITSIGMTDGTNHACNAVFADDGAATMDTARIGGTSYLIKELGPSQAEEGEMTFNSFITDGIRLNYTSAFDQAYRGWVLFIKGDDGIYVGETDINSTQDISDPNFKPDFLLAASTDRTSVVQNAMLSTGVATRGASDAITQRSFTLYNNNGSSSVRCSISHANNRILEDIDASGVNHGLSIDEWRSTGFGVTVHTAGMRMAYMAVKCPSGQSADCGDATTPGSTGAGSSSITPSYSDASEFALFFAGRNNAFDFSQGDNGSSWTFGACDSAETQVTVSTRDDDGSTASESASGYLDSAAMFVYQQAGNEAYTGTIDNLDSPDIDITWNVAVPAGVSRYFSWLAVQVGDDLSTSSTLSSLSSSTVSSLSSISSSTVSSLSSLSSSTVSSLSSLSSSTVSSLSSLSSSTVSSLSSSTVSSLSSLSSSTVSSLSSLSSSTLSSLSSISSSTVSSLSSVSSSTLSSVSSSTVSSLSSVSSSTVSSLSTLSSLSSSTVSSVSSSTVSSLSSSTVSSLSSLSSSTVSSLSSLSSVSSSTVSSLSSSTVSSVSSSTVSTLSSLSSSTASSLSSLSSSTLSSVSSLSSSTLSTASSSSTSSSSVSSSPSSASSSTSSGGPTVAGNPTKGTAEETELSGIAEGGFSADVSGELTATAAGGLSGTVDVTELGV